MFEVIKLATDEVYGTYETLDKARSAVRSAKLQSYAIWSEYNEPVTGAAQYVRVEICDPYEGDDDRVKQMCGMPNASEGN